jgi:large subunit ribosomal protein L6
MSRVGKNPVKIPAGVNVDVAGQSITAKGKKGEHRIELSNEVEITRDGDAIWVKPRSNSQFSRKMWGTARNNINNLIKGVANGFSRSLEINGVGYRAQIQGQTLLIQLGYSHEVRYPIPKGITITCEEQTRLTVSGADKQQVGQTAAEIRDFRRPEPYKGKGIRYTGEYVFRKEGKKK